MNFTRAEAQVFESYCELLKSVCDRDLGGFDGTVALYRPCPHCARKIPPGLPRQLLKSEYVACPACVSKRELAPAVKAALDARTTVLPLVASATPKSPPREAGKVERMRWLLAELRKRRSTQQNERLITAMERAISRCEGI